MNKINFEDGQLVSDGYVEIDGVQHTVTEAEYEGNTPLSALNLNQMQDNIEQHRYTLTLEEDLEEYIANISSVNVRSGPSTSEDVIDNLAKGTKVTVEETSGSWSRISSPVEGWISTSYLATFDPELTIPCNYKVGTDSLKVYFEGELLEKGIHYDEVRRSKQYK